MDTIQGTITHLNALLIGNNFSEELRETINEPIFRYNVFVADVYEQKRGDAIMVNEFVAQQIATLDKQLDKIRTDLNDVFNSIDLLRVDHDEEYFERVGHNFFIANSHRQIRDLNDMKDDMYCMEMKIPAVPWQARYRKYNKALLARKQ